MRKDKDIVLEEGFERYSFSKSDEIPFSEKVQRILYKRVKTEYYASGQIESGVVIDIDNFNGNIIYKVNLDCGPIIWVSSILILK